MTRKETKELREIIFRGKRLDGSGWAYGYYWEVQKNNIIIGAIRTTDLTQTIALVDPDTVGQYIGLNDENGKKIFEGDILAYHSEYPEPHDYMEGVVKYGNFNCSCCGGVYGWYLDDGDIRYLNDGSDGIYVAGNIYDSPELISPPESTT